MTDWHFYEPPKGHRLPHDPLKAIVAPRPIGWISSVDLQGRVNLAPYSFFNAVCENPPIVAFSSSSRKDTQNNVEATGEFVVNLATKSLAENMNASSASVPHEVNEFELARLTPAPCRLVKPPRVADSPAALECKLLLALPLKDLAGNLTRSTVIFGQVVGVHIDTACLVNGLFDMTLAGTIARCGYQGDYAHVTELFQMFRPA